MVGEREPDHSSGSRIGYIDGFSVGGQPHTVVRDGAETSTIHCGRESHVDRRAVRLTIKEPAFPPISGADFPKIREPNPSRLIEHEIVRCTERDISATLV